MRNPAIRNFGFDHATASTSNIGVGRRLRTHVNFADVNSADAGNDRDTMLDLVSVGEHFDLTDAGRRSGEITKALMP